MVVAELHGTTLPSTRHTMGCTPEVQDPTSVTVNTNAAEVLVVGSDGFEDAWMLTAGGGWSMETVSPAEVVGGTGAEPVQWIGWTPPPLTPVPARGEPLSVHAGAPS